MGLLVFCLCCLILPIFTVEQYFSLTVRKFTLLELILRKCVLFQELKFGYREHNTCSQLPKKSVRFLLKIFLYAKLKKTQFLLFQKKIPLTRKLDFCLSMFVVFKTDISMFQVFLVIFPFMGFCNSEIN